MGKYLEQLNTDVKTAMKAREKKVVTVLRMVIAEIQEKQFRKKVDDLSDEDEMQVLQHAVKTRKDSVEQAKKVGREEIAAAEAAEIELIQKYLPAQMSGDELLAKVREVAAQVGYGGPKDTGKFMKQWMAEYKGQADGRAVQEALRSL